MTKKPKLPVVEPKPEGVTPAANDTVARLRQQEILAELGVIALQGAPLGELLDKTAKLVAEGLEADFCKILEYHPSEQRFLVTAGVGWKPDVIGVATVGADIESPAGFALITGKPVISNHLENEKRFRTPELLARHGIRRAMNVILQGDGVPYGVLEVDSQAEGEFSVRDVAFLQGAANVLGMAIERNRIEGNLRAALERNQLLLREVNHRVNNSLALVASMLHLKAATVSEEIKAHLDEASNRITAIARAHHRLYKTENFEMLDLGTYLDDICDNLSESLPDCEVQFSAVVGIEIPPDQAVPVALFVNELVTNAAKHGRGDSKLEIWVKLTSEGEHNVSISVRDNGHGLPENFDIAAQKGLGMRLVSGFAKQLHGEMTIHRHTPGTEFVLTFPLVTH
ncbi:MAG: histidine kinase dimerization/phosphoacceptor domain -containing protein [Pseudolabrys sp.]